MPFGLRRELLEVFEISRLARVTGLDRVPVEVVAAIRPSGHVLQITNGKGTTIERAAASAVGEAAELWAAEHVPADRLCFSAGTGLDASVLDDDGLARAWIEGTQLASREPAWVAAERVFCPPRSGPWLGPSTSSWSSNGLGAHIERGLAVEHAVLEVWERHALAVAVPNGWTVGALRPLVVDWTTELTEAIRARGFAIVPAIVAQRPLPVAAVLLFDLEEPGLPLTAGYACRRTEEAALGAALLEAAQSRLTEIHGARDDVATGERVDGAELLDELEGLPRRPLRRGTVRGWPRAIAERVIVVDVLNTPLRVVKAIGIGLEESELLR